MLDMRWFIQTLRCLLFGRHHYHPVIEIRMNDGDARDRRYLCAHCETPTRWMSPKQLKVWEAEHKPSWSR